MIYQHYLIEAHKKNSAPGSELSNQIYNMNVGVNNITASIDNGNSIKQ